MNVGRRRHLLFSPPDKDDSLTVFRLGAFHFYPAKVMHDHLHRVIHNHQRAWKKNKDKIFREIFVYLNYWLATLYIVAEGFFELKLKDDIIERIIHEHLDDLRRFRNAMFHLQRTNQKHNVFIDRDLKKILWAEELFFEFQDFFTRYSSKMAELQESGFETLDLVGFRRKSAWKE